MKAYTEITQWQVPYTAPNHEYLLDGDRMLAYRAHGQGNPVFFKNPIRFDRRGRKFIEIDTAVFNIAKEVESKLIAVAGSKGNTYYINPEDNSCTCPGYMFRGSCKHVKDLVK